MNKNNKKSSRKRPAYKSSNESSKSKCKCNHNIIDVNDEGEGYLIADQVEPVFVDRSDGVNQGLGWKKYDEQFRLKRAFNLDMSWSDVDSELWLLYMYSPNQYSLSRSVNNSNAVNIRQGGQNISGFENLRVWIVGSSLVKKAFPAAHATGSNLGLDHFGCSIWWQGKSGLRLIDMVPHLKTLSKFENPPAYLIIHCCGNDIGTVPCKWLRDRIDETLDDIKIHFPNTILIWSQILPRKNNLVLFEINHHIVGSVLTVEDMTVDFIGGLEYYYPGSE
ncbi:hypothetical protein LOTGIDRAFT_171395 [Lottia gigantea]|uniref:SGNH hydrolase-type esterase domain-containing protein n=1 Tax=Lottia gigantea TaxID=225164 RepID=V4B7B4_LOTGI|nr:hypothetical protein LOTGIDRAFT_171395 [Lottia gigantea]ESP03456.1 hypothetical protein LOTGIDRAFT_171395 [Lottia gigantea]